MAKQVSEAIAKAMAKEGRRTYPWRKWANGKWWHLEQGIDFDIDPSAFRTAALQWGNKHGYIAEASITQGNDGVVLCFTPE
jgi:hypothetical protein